MSKGFTLVESLIVLFITSLFILLPGIMLADCQRNLAQRQFFASLEQRIILFQQIAVADDTGTYISPNRVQQVVSFTIVGGTDADRQTIEIPKHMHLNSQDRIFFQKGTGKNVGELKKLDFKIGQHNLTYKFQMGYNRFEKEWK